MDPHLRQQFDMLLLTAADRFAERIVQRCEGQANALRQLRDDPEGEGVWLKEFVQAVFEEFCLNTPDGAAFVLAATQRRPVQANVEGTVAQVLDSLAQQVFAALLQQKVIEALERSESYGYVS